MITYVIMVAGDRDWRANVAPTGSDVLIVSYRCPACTASSEVRLQSPPWRIPDPDTDAATYLGPDGHARDGADQFEAARATDSLPHLDVDQIDTELWCHRCQTGAPATITA